LTSQLLTTYKQSISDLRLVPSSGGCFELSVDGQLLYSKLETGKFPDEQWVVDTIGKHLHAERA
jgi:selenoprotein W-related protein